MGSEEGSEATNPITLAPAQAPDVMDGIVSKSHD